MLCLELRAAGKEHGSEGEEEWKEGSVMASEEEETKTELTLMSSAMSVCRLFFSSRSLPTCERERKKAKHDAKKVSFLRS